MSPSSAPRLVQLLQRLGDAEGHDGALDRVIAQEMDGFPNTMEVPDYTASVDRCLELLHRLLPGWHWHLGYGATGVLPYALLSSGGERFEATAPTVPLALLSVICQAKLSLAGEAATSGRSR